MSFGSNSGRSWPRLSTKCVRKASVSTSVSGGDQALEHRPQAQIATDALEVVERHPEPHESARIRYRTRIDQHRAPHQRRPFGRDRHHHLPTIALADENGVLDGERSRHFDEVGRIVERGVFRDLAPVRRAAAAL
jgi:hypothetical protein